MDLQNFDRNGFSFFGNLPPKIYRSPHSLQLRYSKYPPIAVLLCFALLCFIIPYGANSVSRVTGKPLPPFLFDYFIVVVGVVTVVSMFGVYYGHWQKGAVVEIDRANRCIVLHDKSRSLIASEVDSLCLIDATYKNTNHGYHYYRYCQLCVIATGYSEASSCIVACTAYGPSRAVTNFAKEASELLDKPLQLHKAT